VVAFSLRAARRFRVAIAILPAVGCAQPSAECKQAQRDAAKLWAERDHACRTRSDEYLRCAEAQQQIVFLKGELGSLTMLLNSVHSSEEGLRAQARSDAAKMTEQLSFVAELEALVERSAQACGMRGTAPCAAAIRDSQRIEKALACMAHYEAACTALCKSTEPGMSGPSALSAEQKAHLSIIGCLTAGRMYLGGDGVPSDLAAGTEMYKRACELGYQEACSFQVIRP
jgi:TPR repeat protein